MVLDFGGGTGMYRGLWQTDAKYVCLDMDPMKLRGFLQKFPSDAALLSDATRAAVRDGSVDIVLCTSVTHHIPDPFLDQMIRESSRVLKDGGRLTFLDAVLAPRRWRARLLWKLDRGSCPRPAEEPGLTEMKRVIVTGATGFVGANLARRLLRDGHELHLLVRRGYNPWRVNGIRDDVQIHEVSFTEAEAVGRVVARIRPEWVFHLAAYGAYPSQVALDSMIRTNITGTANLINACLASGFEAFVNTGSSSEYGFTSRAATEADRLEPNSHYAVTKASATLLCRHTARAHALHMPTLRLYSVYGPYEEPTRLIPTLITRGLAGELPPLANPDTARDYVYVDDVTDAYLLAAALPPREFGAVYNVGTGVQTSLHDLVALARKELNIPAEPVWGTMDNRIWDTHIWVADPRKIQDELDWQPHHTLEEGFRRTVAWLTESRRCGSWA